MTIPQLTTEQLQAARAAATAARRARADLKNNLRSGKISLSELLRVIQFYNSDNYGCEAGTEDGYAPNDLDQGCSPHASDYNPQDWDIALTELLRSIQFYNIGAYHPCAEGEDGFCAGLLR